MIDRTELLRYFFLIDSSLSRTVIRGKVDRSVSSLKEPPLLDGDSLVRAMNENVGQVAEYILQRSRRPARAPGEFLGCLFTIAEMYSAGIFPQGIFRTWEYKVAAQHNVVNPSVVAPQDILGHLIDFDFRIFSEIATAENELLGPAIEWEIGIGPIHPFYDSCGRIGRYMATLARLWCGSGLPVYGSRDEYMGKAREGIKVFSQYSLGCPKFLE